ncbi:MAG: efflux RND transporter periplasmic adaptor subunit [Planctomycetia bacterium]|nr:efflux RND transporter periplasmic adaptor subunit [Planctomycetia bacterium]
MILIVPDSPLREQLSFFKTARSKVTYPLMTVTGSVLARVSNGEGPIEDRWQFSTAELSTTYTEWIRAKSEVDFAQSQYDKTRELVKAENEHLSAVVKRLQPLSQDAAVATAQFKQSQADLLKSQIQGEKDVFSAQSTLRQAQKSKAALERQLSQSGIEPIVFSRAVAKMVLVVANVPEGRISLVREGQSCHVRFYGYPHDLFPGHVESLSSAVTQDRRTLRVLFDLNDSKDLLKPGLFGEVGLGTDEREAVLVPPGALLHINRGDYVIAALGNHRWQVVEVKLGELHGDRFEVVEGLAGDREIVAAGAILLKPLAIEALGWQATPSPTPVTAVSTTGN